MTEFADSDDVAALVAEDRRRTRSAGATDFLEDLAALPPPAAPGDGTDAPAGAVHPGTAARPEPTRATRVARDVAGGLGESGTQVIGGVRDAFHAALEGVGAFDQWASEKLNLPKMQVLDDEGNLDLRLLSAREAGRAKVVGVPEVREPSTVTGGLVRGVSQFLTGYATGSKILGAFGGATTTAATARAAGSAVFSDLAAFDAHEERLSDLIESNPALSNPITRYLQSDQSDGELEGRLKNVAEGVLSDVAVAGLVAAVRGIRSARRARDGLGAETYAEAQRRLALDPEVGRELVPQLRAARATDAPLVTLAQTVDGPASARELADYLEGAARPGEGAAGAVRPPEGPQVSPVNVAGRNVYVNWGRIDTADDVRSVITQMADASRDEIDAARRGVRSNAETALSAEKENAWSLLVERRQGGTLNAEETLAMRQLWSSSAERLTEAARAVQAAPTPENVFLFRRAVALHGTIQREVIAVRTETARALQQWRIPAGSNDRVAAQIAETVNAFGGADVADDLAARIVGLAEEGNFGAIDGLSRKSALAATHDAVAEYWTNAILSGPKTQLVNAMSNTGVVVLAQIERALAGGLGALRGGGDRVQVREAGAMVHSAIAALPDAWRFARRAFMSGESGFGLHKVEAGRMRAISTEALGNTRSPAFNRAMNMPVVAHGINALGAVVGIPTRTLTAADEFFKTINYRMEVHAQAVRQAMAEAGPDGRALPDLKARIAELVENPPDSVSAKAREFAQYNTFTNDPGRYAAAFRDLRHKAPILRFVLPFINTPANILRFAAERSPIAPLLGDVRADIRAGGARADMAMARMGLGSFGMLTAFDMAMNGQITGSGPSNPAERQALQRTGWQPNSVRIGDRWFAFNRLDPMGAQLGVAANLAEMVRNGDLDAPEDYDEAVYGAIGAVGQMMMDKAYVQGLSDLFSAMSDPERYASSYFEKLAGSFVPAFVREIEGVVDPELRRASNTLDNIRQRIPGLSEQVPVRHDLWGRPISHASDLGPLYDAVSPIYAKREEAEPIDRELQKIGYFPALPATYLTIDRERFPLRNRPEIYEEYVVLQGGTPASEFPPGTTTTGRPSARGERMKSYGDMTLLQTLNAIVGGAHPRSADYADADDTGRADIVRQVIADFRDAARERLIANHPDVFRPGGGRK